jgi:polyisoprenoid-binding protein YceI
MASERWEIDSSHSSLHFSVRHLVIAKVRGSFARWSGTIQVPDGDFSKATVVVTIDASSIDTGVADRDGHLKSPDFFDVAQYPELRFLGKRVQSRAEGEIDVVGELTLKGITREAVLRVEQHGQAKDPWGNVRAAFTAKTSIDRKDFGLTWNQVLETGGVMVGDRVDIEADIEAVKQAEVQVARAAAGEGRNRPSLQFEVIWHRASNGSLLTMRSPL